MQKIELTQGQFALVDDEDFEYLNQFKWCAQKRRDLFVATRRLSKEEGLKNILMHTFIMKQKPIDHIDGNPLNNQRSNLRICTIGQNSFNRGITKRNKTGFKGITHIPNDGRAKKWLMEIKAGDIRIRKRFMTKQEAIEAYKRFAIELHGEFAKW